ncbi:hypothetical protein GLYMA_08G322167v4 [Glycine max]|nr:hypothetical protein GLYMA_08G322167v4 [Glycine max]KAH1054156.1 hypothetical protein GYH30_023097 [Glycine max]
MCTKEMLSRLLSQGHCYFNPCQMLSLSSLVFYWLLVKTASWEWLVTNYILQSLSDAKLELSSLLLALGENSFMGMAEVEVERLHQQKANRMKEIAFKKQDELEKIYAHAYVEINLEAA